MTATSTTNTLFADASFIDKIKPIIELNDTGMPKGGYFGGDCIEGGIRIPYTTDILNPSRLDIHLTCTFQTQGDKIGQPPSVTLFKIIVSPYPMVLPDSDYVPFSIPIPTDIPSTLKDKILPGQVTYKIKVIHEMIDLPVSLYPKASMEISVVERIAANNTIYQSPISSEKELRANLPKDAVGKSKIAKWIKNDTNLSVHCKLSIPVSCFLEGHNIPIYVHVQHIAPVKHMHGIQIQLEQITNMTTPANVGERTVDALVLSEVIIPLICDIEDCSATANCHLTVPDQTPPTLQSTLSPLHISYRIKAIIDVGTHNFLDKATAPSRKRDIAKDMVSSWGKRIGSVDDNGTTTGLLTGNIVELELPITIGTATTTTTTVTTLNDSNASPNTITHTSSLSLSNDSQVSTLSTSSSSLSTFRPKLPARPASISSLQSSSGGTSPSTFYQHHQLIASPISEKRHWIKTTSSLPSLTATDGATLPPRTRLITDPFSLGNHNSSYIGQQQELPSAPDLGDIEGTDKKHGRSWSIPSQGLENLPLYMAN